MSILHRNINPGNVLLRSRATLGSKRYFYCVLSDFGLACDNWDDGNPRTDKFQVDGYKLGTKSYWVPELCYSPYPKGPPGSTEWIKFPGGHRHTQKSDLWALGACIYNLCEVGRTSDPSSHFNLGRLRSILE